MTSQSQLWVYNSENRFVGSSYHNTCCVKRIKWFFEKSVFWDRLIYKYIYECTAPLIFRKSFNTEGNSSYSTDQHFDSIKPYKNHIQNFVLKEFSWNVKQRQNFHKVLFHTLHRGAPFACKWNLVQICFKSPSIAVELFEVNLSRRENVVNWFFFFFTAKLSNIFLFENLVLLVEQDNQSEKTNSSLHPV